MEALVINRNRELSYRVYKRLPEIAKKALDKSNLYPIYKLIAMHLYHKGYGTIKHCISISSNYTIQIRYRETNPKYLIKELKFRGFIPLSQFKDFNPKYCHIITNIKLENDFWVYPENFGITPIHKDMGLRGIYDVWGKYGILSYTKLRYGTD